LCTQWEESKPPYRSKSPRRKRSAESARISSGTPEKSCAGSACRPPPVQDLVRVMPRVVRGTAMLLACSFRSKSWVLSRFGRRGSPVKTCAMRNRGSSLQGAQMDDCSPAVGPQTTRRGAASYRAGSTPTRLLRMPRPPCWRRRWRAGGGLLDSRQIHASPLVLR
jgi:hypothetical protein